MQPTKYISVYVIDSFGISPFIVPKDDRAKRLADVIQLASVHPELVHYIRQVNDEGIFVRTSGTHYTRLEPLLPAHIKVRTHTFPGNGIELHFCPNSGVEVPTGVLQADESMQDLLEGAKLITKEPMTRFFITGIRFDTEDPAAVDEDASFFEQPPEPQMIRDLLSLWALGTLKKAAQCANCSKDNCKLFVCGACMIRTYCCRECQKADHRTHKEICAKVTPLRTSALQCIDRMKARSAGAAE